MAERVMTGALARISVNGTQIGYMRNVRWTENFNDQEVRGLGTIFVQESPVTSHSGTLSCDSYAFDVSKAIFPGSIRRDVQTNQQFEDQMLLRDGFQIDIFKKIEDVVDQNTGLKTAKPKTYAIIRDVFLNSEGADITEGAIAGRNASFRFNSPVIYPS